MTHFPDMDLLDPDHMSAAQVDEVHRGLLARGITGYPLGVYALWTQHDPSVLKRYMLQVDAQMPTREAMLLCNVATLHHYAALRFGPGVAWELEAAARAGLTRREVLDVLSLAYLTDGPSTQGPAHQEADTLLRDWTDPTADARARFPAGWEHDPAAFASGIEVSSPPEMTDQEMRGLYDWYRRTTGEVPAGVELLATYRPALLKAYRLRWENCFRALPKQVMPFVMLHHNAMRRDVASLHDAALLGRAWGMTRDQVVSAVTVGLTFGDGLEPMNTVHAALADILATWPDPD